MSFFKEFLDYNATRIKKPFTGAYITVFIIHNWKLIYILLFPDEACGLERRLELVSNVISSYNHPYKTIFFEPLLIAMLVLISFLIFNYSLYTTELRIKKLFVFAINNLRRKIELNKFEDIQNEINYLKGKVYQAEERVKFIKTHFRNGEYNLTSNNSVTYTGKAPEEQLNTNSHVWEDSELTPEIQELKNTSYPLFIGAKFISPQQSLSLIEAKKGGVYYFKFSFRLELNPDVDIKSCKISILTKGQLFGWTNRKANEAADFIYGGPDNPHIYQDYLRNLQVGYNEIIFKLVNKEDENIDHSSQNICGFMFNIKFILTE